MKALIFTRDKVVKIRYDKDSELPIILVELCKIPNLDIDVKGYVG